MRHSRSSRFIKNVIRLIIILFLFSIFIFGFIIPRMAENTFGPNSESLQIYKKIYWSTFVILKKDNLTSPNHAIKEDTTFQVKIGESAASISQRLEEAGLIKDPVAFRGYLIYSGIDTKIKAGDYILNPNMSPVQIAAEIQDAISEYVEITVLAGWRSEEIALAIPYSGLEFSPAKFIENIRLNGLEGYIFPGTYTLPRNVSLEDFLNILQDSFKKNLTKEIEVGFSKQGLTIHEAVILASIVERETVVAEEMPLVASVFINRLNSGMLLNADPTIQYALGYNSTQETWWTNPLSNTDLAVESPYNTYLIPGLPPGPICNPGLDALKAVAFPAQTSYFYFRVSCDDPTRHTFSKTLDEHVNNACP